MDEQPKPGEVWYYRADYMDDHLLQTHQLWMPHVALDHGDRIVMVRLVHVLPKTKKRLSSVYVWDFTPDEFYRTPIEALEAAAVAARKTAEDRLRIASLIDVEVDRLRKAQNGVALPL